MNIKPIVISFKQSEEWISDYAREHNSPAAWIKDLIIQDYKEKKGAKDNIRTISTGLFDD